MTWWWLSFCDPEKPKGSQFLGAAIVEAEGFMEAITRSHLLRINPGGEVKGEELTKKPPDCYLNRLLSKEEIRRGADL